MDYWLHTLAGLNAVHGLPLDRPRGQTQSRTRGIFTTELLDVHCDSLQRLASQEGVTQFVLLHTVFTVLLARWSRETDIITGTFLPDPKLKALALRSEIDNAATFRAQLARNHECVCSAFKHADVPFNDLVAQLGSASERSCHPIFQVMFSYQRESADSSETEMSLVPNHLADGFDTAQLDLSVHVTESDQGLFIRWDSDANLLDESSIRSFANSFQLLLKTLDSVMDLPVSKIPVLDESERGAILSRTPQSIYPREAGIAALVEEQARKRAQAVAVIHGTHIVSYAELNRRANAIACALLNAGVQPGDRIGVYMERGVELVAAVLGILKTGAAYVPLDTKAPEARLKYMVSDTGMRLIICESWKPPEKNGLREVRHIYVDQITGDSEVPLPAQSGGESLAYVMYTSGSTGMPKGVAVPHRGVVRLVKNTDYACLDAATVMAQLSNVAFDAYTFEVWGALCNGGRVVVLDQEQILESRAFADAATTYGLNTAVITSSLFSRFAQERPDCFSGFRDLLAGGEQVSLDAVQRVLAAGAPERLSNAYGPTENTVISTTCELTNTHVSHGVIPIGRTIAHSQCYVVNEALELQPKGAIGELVVAGDGLALGYWRRPELTAKSFVTSPASWGVSTRLYRTGDLVRWLPSGELKYLGRLDSQVKIRGFRIEPGEIEHALRSLPDIQDAVVVVHEEEGADARHLVAYYVSDSGEEIAATQLRELLAKNLPSYMVPTAYVAMPELPLTRNGKLDRNALPVPDAVAYGRASYELPHPGMETWLAQQWQQLLKTSRIGRHDDFIALGGNSLLLGRLVSEIKIEFKIDPGFRDVYEARTLTELATLIEACRNYGEHMLPDIVPGDSDAERPLSFAQQSLHFIDRLNGGDASYNLSYSYRLRGTLNIKAMRGALQAVVMRHESLRTVFREHNGKEVQHILAGTNFQLMEEVLPSSHKPDVTEALRQIAEAEVLLPFDLANDLLLRARLIRVKPDEWLLVLTMHHIAADGWSFALLLEEISKFYDAFSKGDGNPFDPLPVQYVDYARWQRTLLDNQEQRDQLLTYWHRQLGDLPVEHQLPRDEIVKITPRRAALFNSRIPAKSVRHLRELGLKHDATLFMILQTAFALLLSRWSGETDIVMGTPVANRDDPRLARLIGYFVNSVVLRSNTDGNPLFTELLARNRSMVLDAFDHQSLPFELLVEALNPERDPDSTPLFQIMFVLQNNEVNDLSLPNMSVEPLPRQVSKGKFDLTLNAIPANDEVTLEWEYRADRFSAATMKRMADSFGVLLEGLLAAPDCTVLELPLLPKTERQQLLSWSELAVDDVPVCGIHQLFERRAAAQPEHIAVRYRSESLSFAELDKRADKLANFLYAEGVRPGELVGLCLPRSVDFLVSVLAVWKVGAAYVPLDPNSPIARHDYIVNDAGIHRVLTHSRFKSRFTGNEKSAFCLDQPDCVRRVNTSSKRPDTGPFNSDSLAYVIYTSGSTGEPKGVLVEHRAVTRLLGATDQLGYDSETVMLQSVNVAFDASVLETWAPLCCGGQLVLYPEQSPEPSALCGLIAAYDINTLTLPAALLDAWVEQLETASGLNCVIVGGEALSPDTVARLYVLDEKVVVINHYGPTENGVLTSYYRIPRDFKSPVPIGLPAPGTQLFVLNESCQLQPAGAVGELFVAGQGLARGYLNREKLTAEKFLPSKIDAASRWYRTGDLVRWQIPDNGGQAILHFVSRTDQQVKIRGFRIELGEIEAHLCDCSNVRDAKVIVHCSTSGEKQLLAYVIAEADSRSDWRARLQKNLPDYMVPAGFVLVEEWPLTQNGKLNLEVLPAPDREAYTQTAFVAASTEMEKALHSIWCDLLKVDRISIDDSFFHLGGHSLLATRLQNRIRADLKLDMPLRTLFEAQTIRKLSVRLEALQDTQPTIPQPEPVTDDPRSGAPLSYSQQRLWFIHHLDTETAQYHIPYRVRLEGQLDVGALRAALTDLVIRHQVLHTAFMEIDGEPRQVCKPFVEFDLPVYDIAGLSENEQEAKTNKILLEEAHRAFDLKRGPLLRGCVVKQSEYEHCLALTLHHIIADGWSIGIFEHELSALYSTHLSDDPSSLKPLSLQYSDYAHWQRRWLDESNLEPHYKYWQKQLHDMPLLHNLPLDHPRPPVQSNQGAVQRLVLTAKTIKRLEVLAQQHDATLFMVFHGAFALLLSRISGEADIVMGTPVANRRDESLAPLIGSFINTLVLRSDLSGEPTFIELLEQSKRLALDAYEHQDMPFDLLVEHLNPERSPAYSPLFQILFILQNNETSTLHLSGIKSTQIPFAERTAKFDLTLSIQPDCDDMLVEWEYNPDLFDGNTIEQFAAAYTELLSGILESPHSAITDLPISADFFRPDGSVDLLIPSGTQIEEHIDHPEVDGDLHAGNDTVPPENDLQCELAIIWEDMLKQKDIGITDNFFALGGTSLLALRLGNCLHDTYNFELDLKTFFGDPTIRALADKIHHQQQVNLSKQRFEDFGSSETIEF